MRSYLHKKTLVCKFPLQYLPYLGRALLPKLQFITLSLALSRVPASAEHRTTPGEGVPVAKLCSGDPAGAGKVITPEAALPYVTASKKCREKSPQQTSGYTSRRTGCVQFRLAVHLVEPFPAVWQKGHTMDNARGFYNRQPKTLALCRALPPPQTPPAPSAVGGFALRRPGPAAPCAGSSSLGRGRGAVTHSLSPVELADSSRRSCLGSGSGAESHFVITSQPLQ